VDLSDRMMKIIESRDYSEEHISMLLEFAIAYHGVAYARDKIDEYLAAAETIINDFTFHNEIKTVMNLFLSYLKERSY
jgi:hypothetical protein